MLVRVQPAVCQSCVASLCASTDLLGSLVPGQTFPPGYPRGKGLCDDGDGQFVAEFCEDVLGGNNLVPCDVAK